MRGMGVRITLLALAGIILLSAFLAYSGAAKDSPTYDEPLHLAASYVTRHHHDLRVNPEHPPLWKYLIGLTMSREDLPTVDLSSPLYQRLADVPRAQWQWAASVLYRSPTPLALDDLFARARTVTLFWGVALLLLTALLGWQLARHPPEAALEAPGQAYPRAPVSPFRAAALVAPLLASALIAFDPTFLAHTVLITNDVPFALSCLLFLTFLALLCERLTVIRICLLALGAGLGMVIKFSAIVFLPIALVALAWRAVSSREWGLFRHRQLSSRVSKLLGGTAVLSIAFVGSMLVIAGTYAFFSAANQSLPTSPEVAEIQRLNNGQLPLSTRIVDAIHGHNALIPQPLTRGLLTQQRISQTSRAFILGENHNPAPWYALPLAYLLKTPTATLLLLLLAGGLGCARLVEGRRAGSPSRAEGERPSWGSFSFQLRAVFGIAIIILLALALLSGRARGVRYLLPLLPPLYLLAAHVIATHRARWPRYVAGLLIALSVAELLTVSHRYISFFNIPARLLVPPHRLLGDSNLDWGQGLSELAGWQKANPPTPTQPLYLAYFGNADPRSFNLRYTPAPGTFLLDAQTSQPTPGSLLAISATLLQGTYLSPELQALYKPYQTKQPYASLAGGSILVFKVE